MSLGSKLRTFLYQRLDNRWKLEWYKREVYIKLSVHALLNLDWSWRRNLVKIYFLLDRLADKQERKEVAKLANDVISFLLKQGYRVELGGDTDRVPGYKELCNMVTQFEKEAKNRVVKIIL